MSCRILLFALLLLTTTTACLPPMAVMQDAKLLGQDKVELTPYGTLTGLRVSDDNLASQGGGGVHLAVGTGGNFDVHADVSFHHVDSDRSSGIPATVMEVGAKISLIEDRLALYIPAQAGFLLTSSGLGGVFGVSPTVLFTLPVTESLSFTPFARLMIPMVDLKSMSAHVAAGVNSRIQITKNVALVPEVSALFYKGPLSLSSSEALVVSGSLGLNFGF